MSKTSAKDTENIKLKTIILDTYYKHDQAVGYVPMTHYLKDEFCIKISSGRVVQTNEQNEFTKNRTVKAHKYIKNKEETDNSNLENLLK